MSFVHLAYLPWVIGLFVLFTLLVLIFEFRYFAWVKRYWFLRRSWISRFSTLFYLLGVGLLLFSLLDLRGKEIRIKANIPDQKTVILIDASMSMLAEDVRPSRFQRSLLMARHFVSKAVGHQIAVSMFSDHERNIIPFTDDIDLLDARIAAFEQANLQNAGTNLKSALAEAVQELKAEIGEDENANGNILVFSDAEEHGSFKNFEVSSGINVAFVGVGTLQGAAIPIRSGSGQYTYFDSFKQYKGERVETRLNEDFIKRLGSSIKSYRYWIASSYSMPTDEILSFFRGIHKAKAAQGDVRVRPVMYEYVVIPGVIFLAIGFLLTLPKTFLVLLLCMLFNVTSPLYAQESSEEKEPQKKLSPQTEQFLQKLKKGELSPEEKLKLGELLLKDGKSPEAVEIYKENKVEEKNNKEALFNYGTANLKAGKIAEGVEALNKLRKKLEASPSDENKKIIEQIDHNLALAFKAEKQKKQQGQNQKQDQQNQDKKDQQEKQQDKQQDKQDSKKDQKGQQNKQEQKPSKDGQKKDEKKGNPQDQKNQSQQQKGSGQEKEEEKKQQEKKKNEDKGQEKDQDKENEKKEQEKKPMSLEEREEQIKRQRSMNKLSGMLKELMNVDRQLQQKFLDTRIKDRVQDRDHKDW